ncbi:MAG TPA: SCO family protein [Trebonia sp.]|nr:SCO family protein [Trebonia sp.]
MSGGQATAPAAETSGSGGAGDGTPEPRGRNRRRARLLLAGATAVVVASVAAVSAYLVTRPGSNQNAAPRVSGIPSVLSDSTVNLMELDALPHVTAPGFTFTDQNGKTMSLSAFRGKVVVLEFLDPHCIDICPIVSHEFVDAYHDLGANASKVVFLGINVNQYHAGVADVMAFSKEQQLTTIPDWHYFTGPLPALQTAWKNYNIYVQAPSPSADIVHTSAVYFIGPDGTERYLASPQVDHNKSGTSFLPPDQMVAWGHGIADLALTMAK